MRWNWTQPDWPNFRYEQAPIERLERQFLLSSGEILGAVRHVAGNDRDILRIELLSEEALRTSAIEGEVLDRSSVQSSLRRQFGLSTDAAPTRPREQGVAEMMADVYSTSRAPLTHDTLCRLHGMLMAHDKGLETIGAYRRHDEAMQIVSGRIDRQTVHFEAPPSKQVQAEMAVFLDWFNRTAPNGSAPMPALTRAALGHLWFESIHPFEDGNGRIGRALAEKSLSQNIGQPSLIALAYTIERNRKAYYDQLEIHQRTLEVTAWLQWFAEIVLEAQAVTSARISFFIAKARFFDRFRDRLNERQAKVMARMFREGPDGFKGGLSAENYLSITGTSRATATRDLQDLVEIGAVSRTGERRYARYCLVLEL